MPDLPDVHFGTVDVSGNDYGLPELDDDSDTDDELGETPEDIIDLLGFDPLEKEEEVKADSVKLKKESVLYTPHSTNPNEHCAICVMFRAPNECSAVEDEISPEGWCKLFEVRDERLDSIISLIEKLVG